MRVWWGEAVWRGHHKDFLDASQFQGLQGEGYEEVRAHWQEGLRRACIQWGPVVIGPVHVCINIFLQGSWIPLPPPPPFNDTTYLD